MGGEGRGGEARRGEGEGRDGAEGGKGGKGGEGGRHTVKGLLAIGLPSMVTSNRCAPSHLCAACAC